MWVLRRLYPQQTEVGLSIRQSRIPSCSTQPGPTTAMCAHRSVLLLTGQNTRLPALSAAYIAFSIRLNLSPLVTLLSLVAAIRISTPRESLTACLLAQLATPNLWGHC